MFDVVELVKRVLKYLFEGIIVAIAAFVIPKRSLNIEEILIPRNVQNAPLAVRILGMFCAAIRSVPSPLRHIP